MRWTDWGMVWNGKCLTAKISESPNPEKGCTLSDILMKDAEEKYFLSPKQAPQGHLFVDLVIRPGAQGERVYSPEGVSCTLAAQTGGFGGKTGLYEVGLPIKENTKKGYKMAYPGDSINLAFAQKNTRRGRVGRKIAHTLTASSDQGTLEPLKRIRRLTPRECLRLQGWADERIDIVLPLQSDAQLYKQAGNGVTVTVVEAIGKRLAATHREVSAID